MPTDPELIKQIMVKDFDSFIDRAVSDHCTSIASLVSRARPSHEKRGVFFVRRSGSRNYS